MTITIYRGIDQIGGCITEIESSNGTKIDCAYETVGD